MDFIGYTNTIGEPLATSEGGELVDDDGGGKIVVRLNDTPSKQWYPIS